MTTGDALAPIAALANRFTENGSLIYASDLRAILADHIGAVAAHDAKIRAEALREAADRAEELTGTKADWLYTLAELTEAASVG